MRSIVTTAAVLGAAAVLAPAANAADNWALRVEQPTTAEQLGLKAGTPAPALARAAIARRLGLRKLELAGQDTRSPDMRALRFRQTAGGLRVLWSEIDVLVSGDRVGAINATTVPMKTRRLSGAKRISSARAARIARRAFHGRAAKPELVAFAGSPAKPRTPRRAYVVQVAGKGATTWCVVVDARSGRVLERWKGTAAVQPDASPKANASATTVLYQLTNFKRKDPTGYAYGLTRLLLTTTGNPFNYGDDGGLGATFLDVFSTNISFLAPWMTDVTRFFCRAPRRLCGRRAQGSGSYGRHFLVGNHTGDETSYRPSDEHVIIGENDADDPDVVAHEIGHELDHHLRNDYLQTFEADEIDEALADMFSYDWDNDAIFRDGPKPLSGQQSNPDDGDVMLNYANPALSGDPAHYNQYSCSTSDEHDNGSILSHGYYKLTKRIGDEAAGFLLTYVPWQLPARREFGDVRQAFEIVARNLYNGGVKDGFHEKQVEAAFNEVGVFDASRRPDRCPGAGA